MFISKSVLLLFCSFLFTFKSNGQQDLLKAIDNNDTASFNRILASGYNVNKVKAIIQTKFSIPRKRISRYRTVYIDKHARKGRPLFWIKRTEPTLTQAVFKGNYYFTEQLLKHGANPNKKRNLVLNPICWAAHLGYADIVKLLLDHGADINGSEKKERTTALMEALDQQMWGIAEFLVEKGADLHIVDQYGLTALNYAAIYKNEKLVRMIVEKGGDIHYKSKESETTILESACSDEKLFAPPATNFEIIKYLVGKGISVNDNAIKTVLRKGEFEIAKYLFSKGTPATNELVLAASNGRNFEMFRYLIDSIHLDINYYDREVYWGGNVLHNICSGYWAPGTIRIVNIPMLQYILDKGVCVNDTNMRGQTPLLLLLEYGKTDENAREATDLLVNKGANVNIPGGDLNFSPLMYASTDKLIETAKLLIKNGADINYKDHDNRYILHWAAWTRNNEEMIRLLVQSGANINARDGRGETAAMSCVVFGSNENIKALIELGTDLTIKDNNGLTLLDHVSDDKIIEFLKSKGAKSGKEIQ